MTAPATARVARWRIAAGIAVLAFLAVFGAELAPVYYRNYELQRYVEDITQRSGNESRSDDLLRTWVLEKAADLDLPVKADNVQVKRSPDGLRIEIRYLVRVNLPIYTVDLHFYPGASAR